MDRDEAFKVASVAIKADGGCPVCAVDQLDSLEKLFPQFDWAELGARAESINDEEYEYYCESFRSSINELKG